MKKTILTVFAAAIAMGVAGCAIEEQATEQQSGNEEQVAEHAHSDNELSAASSESDIALMHVHGLGFAEDGSGLYVPAHDGLKVFEDGVWRDKEGEKHDYMGFVMTEDGFYSSGHPAPGSELENPFGVVRSTDMGQTLETLDLYKEIDFHFMAVGYRSQAIYVLNPEPNSRMDQTGLYYSNDNAVTWTKSASKGLEGQLITLAAHPDEAATVVVGTDKGLFISTDSGNQFKQLTETPTTAAAFSADGKLVTGNLSTPFSLTVVDQETGEQSAYSIPELTKQNAISYIAVNPQNPEELAFSTFERDIYLSQDGGNTWNEIAAKGTAKNFN